MKPTGGLFSINTINNPICEKIRSCRSISGRNENNEFVIEDMDFILQAIDSKNKVNHIVLNENSYMEGAFNELASKNHNVPVHLIKERIMEKLFPTNTPKSLAICAQLHRYYDHIDKFNRHKDIVLLDSVVNPRNLGMIFRSVESFGIGGVLLTSQDGITEKGTILDQLYSRLAIKTSRGSILRVPFFHTTQEDVVNFCQKHQYELICTSVQPPKKHKKKSTKKKGQSEEEKTPPQTYKGRVIVLGNESNGVSPFFLKNAHRLIHIPTFIESLNVSVASGIVLYMLMIEEKKLTQEI